MSSLASPAHYSSTQQYQPAHTNHNKQQYNTATMNTNQEQLNLQQSLENTQTNTQLQSSQYPPRNNSLPSLYWTIRPFVLGGISACIAQTIIQPIDMIKTRTQLAGEGNKLRVSPLKIARDIVKSDGILSLYRGLSAGYMRQVTYGVGRLGLFRTFSDYLQKKQDDRLGVTQPMPFYVKMICGSTAGAFGAILGTPADVALVRMQADTMLPVDQRRNYRNGVHAIISIVRSEGISGMFSGCTPTVARAMVQNAMMLGSYEQAKEFYKLQLPHTVQQSTINFIASVTAGLTACCVSLPFDFMKSRMQKQQRRADGTFQYKSMVDVARQTIQSEGPLALYKGFSMYVVRIAPHSIITLCTLDYLVDKLKRRGL